MNLGADLSVRDEAGITAMHYAAERSTRELIKRFSEHGADANWSDHESETPIFWALKESTGNISMIQTFIDLNADTNYVNIHGQALLLFAAHARCPKSTSLLLQLGANVHHKGGMGMTPLHWAVTDALFPRREVYLVEVIKILIEHGADVNSRTVELWTV